MDTLAWPLRLVGLIAAGLAVLTAAGVLLRAGHGYAAGFGRSSGRRPLRWLPAAGGVLGAAALIGFAIRPYVQIVRVHANPATAAFVARLQRLEHLPVDPSRPTPRTRCTGSFGTSGRPRSCSVASAWPCSCAVPCAPC